jgi:hypothetical protein
VGPEKATASALQQAAAGPIESREAAQRSHDSAAILSSRISSLAFENLEAAELLGHLASLTNQMDAASIAAVSSVLDRGSGLTAVTAILDIFADAGFVSRREAIQWREAFAAALVQADESPHDAVAVDASGLILLWPFLHAYFDRLELLDGEQFRDVAAQHRAATLLHGIATGEIACPEQELALIKVLVGLDIDAIHDPGEPLDRSELQSVDALLSDVLGHAPMLGRISTAGLREAFLKRPGLLSTRDGHWLLRVERRSIDILLDRLPWSFAWVGLPWMAAPMQVEW